VNATSWITVAWPFGVMVVGFRFRPRPRPMLDPAGFDCGAGPGGDGDGPARRPEPVGRDDPGGAAPDPDLGDEADGAPPAPPYRGRGRARRAEGVWAQVGPVVESLGRVVRAAARRPPDGEADRNVGLALLVSGFLVATAPGLVVLVPMAACAVPRVRRRRRLRAEAGAVADELPLAADLFVLAAGAGLTVPMAVAAVAPRTTGPLGTALRQAQRRTDLGQHPADALGGVVDQAGESVRPLVGVLVSAERYGTPLVGPLERVADEVRRQRRRHAEEVARRVPVKLLFPLVLCTLPAFGLLTVVPLLVSAFAGLRV